MKLADVKIGNKIYFQEPWTGACTAAVIKDIKLTEDGKPYFTVNCTDGDVGSIDCMPEECYQTKEECNIAMRAKNKKEIKEYKNSMRTIDDMLNFALNNVIACAEEYTDWNARQAFIERATELGFSVEQK